LNGDSRFHRKPGAATGALRELPVFIAVSGNTIPSPAKTQWKRNNSFVETKFAADRIVRLNKSSGHRSHELVIGELAIERQERSRFSLKFNCQLPMPNSPIYG
jgi:hypothetical protein